MNQDELFKRLQVIKKMIMWEKSMCNWYRSSARLSMNRICTLKDEAKFVQTLNQALGTESKL